MLSPKLYKNSDRYGFFIRMLGYESSIERFLQSLELQCHSGCRILDVGCGTGLIGLHFLERLPKSTLLATDLEPNFLRSVVANAERKELAEDRIKLAVSNVSLPHQIIDSDGVTRELPNESFDLICVGAVLGYARDTEASLRKLLNLLAPGGYLINLEMNESLAGRFVSQRYHYDNLRLANLAELVREEACEVTTKSFKLHHLPAKLTRTAIIAQKPTL